MKILVIDDEVGLRRSLCAYLEDLGYDALDAANGLEGLAVMRDNIGNLAAVIVDLNMPVLDGYGFLRQAREEAPELPVIVLSGVGVVDDALQSVRPGPLGPPEQASAQFSILEHTPARPWKRPGSSVKTGSIRPTSRSLSGSVRPNSSAHAGRSCTV
jgi:putative two-component system response regulator